MKISSILTLGTVNLLMACAAFSATSNERSYIAADNAAWRAQLPFSDAVRVGDTLYVSGTLGIDPATAADPKNSRVASDPADEARYALEAVRHTLEAAGYTMDDLVSVQIYCTDLDLYGTFNDVYRTFFHDHFPARAFVGVSKLVRSARFEVMGVAVKKGR